MTSSSSSSTKIRANTESVNHEIAQQFSSKSGKTIYAEVPKGAEEGNSNQRQSSIQYADLNWSTNISKVEQNESKPVEDQRRNYFGPMGDVYARIQKGWRIDCYQCRQFWSYRWFPEMYSFLRLKYWLL